MKEGPTSFRNRGQKPVTPPPQLRRSLAEGTGPPGKSRPLRSLTCEIGAAMTAMCPQPLHNLASSYYASKTELLGLSYNNCASTTPQHQLRCKCVDSAEGLLDLAANRHQGGISPRATDGNSLPRMQTPTAHTTNVRQHHRSRQPAKTHRKKNPIFVAHLCGRAP